MPQLMQDLIIKLTNHTPEINFNGSTGLLSISGTATPEDAVRFFNPVLKWLEEYRSMPAKSTRLVFKMDYFNTSSTVFMLRIIRAVASIGESDVAIEWYYKNGDDDSIEAGRDFGALTKFKIDLIPLQ